MHLPAMIGYNNSEGTHNTPGLICFMTKSLGRLMVCQGHDTSVLTASLPRGSNLSPFKSGFASASVLVRLFCGEETCLHQDTANTGQLLQSMSLQLHAGAVLHAGNGTTFREPISSEPSLQKAAPTCRLVASCQSSCLSSLRVLKLLMALPIANH